MAYRSRCSRFNTSLKTPYILHSPSGEEFKSQEWKDPFIQGVSIDPSINHYAIVIERRYYSGQIMIIYMQEFNFPASSTELTQGGVYQSACSDITSILDSLKGYYPECHYFVVESQPPISEDMLRIAQHTISYFLFNCASLPLKPRILEVEAKLRVKVLGAPPGLNKKDLKQWSADKGVELLTLRGDKRGITLLGTKKRIHDKTDALIQFEALMIVLGYPSTKDCIELRQKRHEQQAGIISGKAE